MPIDWQHTVPEGQAVQEVGMFGNQNTVCKPVTPSWRTTVERLKERFGVGCPPPRTASRSNPAPP